MIPYIKAKLDALYLREQEDDLLRAPVQRSQFGVRCRRCFAALFPFVHAAYELSFVGYLLAYAVGSSQYSSPLLHLARQTLTRQAVPGSSLVRFDALRAVVCASSVRSVLSVCYDSLMRL